MFFRIYAFDVVDDPDCGCESCTTPWGTEVPLARQYLERRAFRMPVQRVAFESWTSPAASYWLPVKC